METARSATKDFLLGVQKYFDPQTYEGFWTSRTIEPTQLSREDIQQAVEMGKFEAIGADTLGENKLPWGYHSVNGFAVPEMKGRRWLITEPHLNSAIRTSDVPNVTYPTRLGRRQSLRQCKYMLQIDFEAFYDAIPIPGEMGNKFVFRKGKGFFRLKTLPTGARWSVAVGQAVTWTIVDVETEVTVHTLIDNVLIAAKEGQEAEFVRTVRKILGRMREANLLTSPNRDELMAMSDEALLTEAEKAVTFLGEEYAWFSCRSFVSLVSLELYALHTTRMNPASAFQLLRAYRGVYRRVTEGVDWDSGLPYLDARVHAKMVALGEALYQNDWWRIADERHPTYDEAYYDAIVFTDASYAGWGAIARNRAEGTVTTYQQKWERSFFNRNSPYSAGLVRNRGFFNAQHSAHAEPRAAQLALGQLVREGLPDGARVALATDHEAIVHAQRRANGFGGIGRGYSLNKLFEYVHDLWYRNGIEVTFFQISGPSNPADTLSRVFGGEARGGQIVRKPAATTCLPSLRYTSSPVCEG
eukprot:gene7757-gene6129